MWHSNFGDFWVARCIKGLTHSSLVGCCRGSIRCDRTHVLVAHGMQWACILFGDHVKMQHQMPLYIGICWCSFLTGVTENIIDWFSQTLNRWLLWFLTTLLLLSQKLQVNLRLASFSGPFVEVHETLCLFFHKMLGLVNYFHNMHTAGHSFHCLAQCGLCSFQTGVRFSWLFMHDVVTF